MFSVEFLKRWYNGMLKIFECDQSPYFFLKCAVVRAECTKTRIVDVSVTYVTVLISRYDLLHYRW